MTTKTGCLENSKEGESTMKNDYSRKVSMICPICGNDQFSAPDLGDMELLSDAPDDTRIQCADCGTIFTKGELIKENQGVIDANLEEIADEFAADVQRELDKQFKKFK